MATSLNDPRILAAINKALAWSKTQVGKANARSIWAYVYPEWTNTGYAWCGGFQVAAFKYAGVDLMKCAWWFYTPYIKNFAVNIGAWKTNPGTQNDGDNTLFDWQLDGVIDHVGMSWRDQNASLFRNIEGNTSSSASGSQDNGGQCAIKYRSYPPIRGWVDMRKVLAWMIDTGRWDGKTTGSTPSYTTPAAKKKNSTDGNYLVDEDGIRGSVTNSRWQQVMGTPIDGRIDKPSTCVKQFQRFLNTAVPSKWQQTLNKENSLAIDGYLGLKTWRVFQYWFGATYPDAMKSICGFTRTSNNDRFWSEWCNGVEGVWTQKALQWILNRSWANTGALGSKNKPSNTPTPTPAKPSTSNDKTPDGKALLDVDGIRGAATLARWREVMNANSDSIAIKKTQQFLNKSVSSGDIKTLTGSVKLSEDGALGWRTWKVFQYWFGLIYPDKMKNICGFNLNTDRSKFWNEWCDGISGTWTNKALQTTLNYSWAKSGKLGAK